MIIFRGRDVRFHLDRDVGLLMQGDRRIDLPKQQYELLQYLAETRPGKLINREELLDHIWGGKTVNEEALTRALYRLRQVLGDDDPRHPSFIETVKGRGVRFVAVIEPEDDPTANRHKSNGRHLAKTPVSREVTGSVKETTELEGVENLESLALPNEQIMEFLKAWNRRPASCEGQTIVGHFTVEGRGSPDFACEKVVRDRLGLPLGDCVEYSLHTLRDSKNNYEYFYGQAFGAWADLLEHAAAGSRWLVRLKGFGSYLYKLDYPDLDTGRMLHHREAKPVVIIDAATPWEAGENENAAE